MVSDATNYSGTKSFSFIIVISIKYLDKINDTNHKATQILSSILYHFAMNKNYYMSSNTRMRLYF
jgi:hypothetical protein